MVVITCCEADWEGRGWGGGGGGGDHDMRQPKMVRGSTIRVSPNDSGSCWSAGRACGQLGCAEGQDFTNEGQGGGWRWQPGLHSVFQTFSIGANPR